MKKEIKGFVCGVVVAAIIGAGIASAAGTWESIDVLRNDINIVVNGQPVEVDNFLYNDTTYVPLRAVSSTLGENVDYDETTNTAYIGEKYDNIVSKHIPPDDPAILAFVEEKDGVYYISPDCILYEMETPFNDTNISDIINNGATTLVVKGQSWDMTFIDGVPYIPYDTYVDEIEPLLK